MGKKFENIVIFVSDSLRYDYFPEELEGKSGVIPTLAPSLHTPTSFASLHTALSPENHTVRDFLEDLDASLPTGFDFFENSSLYNGPEQGWLNQGIFRTGVKDLEEMKQPFFWVERIMLTHLPYGKIDHEREYDFEMSGWEYIRQGKEGERDLEQEYKEGVEKMKEYVMSQIDYLEEEGMLDETLVIITSDHGELLGERFLGRRRYEHNYPPLQELAQVPTVFYNYDVDAECMRLIDVVPTALSLAGKDVDLGDGVDVMEETVKEGRNIMEDPKAHFDTQWVFKNGEWRPIFSSQLQIIGKTIIGDLKKSVYNYGGKQLKQKIEDKIEKESADEVVDEIDF